MVCSYIGTSVRAGRLPDGSRVRREPHARFYERPAVQFRRPTHPPVPVLDPGRGKTKTGRLWVAVRDERPFGSMAPPAAFYLYSSDGKAEHARTLLEPCRGFLHADGYAGFANLYQPDPKTGAAKLVEVACWAHARRYLYDVHVETSSPAAREALDLIARLFAIEADIRGRSPVERRDARQKDSLQILAELKLLLDATLAKISGKSSLAHAIRYATSRWTALTRFTEDGRLEMTNNAAERAIRPIALGRKNFSSPAQTLEDNAPRSCTRSLRAPNSTMLIPRLG